MPRVIGVDVGGTFTDIVEYSAGSISARKVPTSEDQSDSVVEAVEGSSKDVFLHGTTAATNALLEGRGARVALITDDGYADLLEIARQDRPSLYDSSISRPIPLVAREDRYGVDVSASAMSGVEAVAVGLVESYLDPDPERALAAEVEEELGVPAIASADVSPEFREYERLATTVLSAYLTPSVSTYLRNLDGRLDIGSKLVMTSAGGLLPFSRAPGSAGRLVLSGPAGGAVAAAALGRFHGYDSVLSFDMGGTSTDVSRISEGRLSVGSGHHIEGRVNRVPSVPIRTIGAGGGSIGWLDPGGALRVGPMSAGSIPGPAAYGRGGLEPTVTDANLVAGRIPADLALGGTVVLDLSAATAAVQRLGEQAGLGASETAAGMIEVVDSHMEHALRSVSVEEGADPREAVLVAFGGAGGLHAVRLARRLGMSKVLIPPHSGVFSALGLLMASPRSDAARTVMLDEGDVRLGGLAREVSTEAFARFEALFGAVPTVSAVSADVRYVGQSHELEVSSEPEWPAVRQAFEEAHRQMFGFARPDEPVEVVNLRTAATGAAPLSWEDLPGVAADLSPRRVGSTWDRGTLPTDTTVVGPATVVERNSAVVVEEGSVLRVLADGTLEIDT